MSIKERFNKELMCDCDEGGVSTHCTSNPATVLAFFKKELEMLAEEVEKLKRNGERPTDLLIGLNDAKDLIRQKADELN